MNEKIFKISGKDRKVLKKEYNYLKSFIKNFWYYHQLDKDMTSFYGGKDDYPMNDIEAEKVFNRYKKELLEIENKLKEKL